MKVYDSKGRLTVDFKLHADKHESGGADALALGSIAGNLTDAQHGSRSVANAHAHSHLSGIGSSDHHAKTTSFADITDRAGASKLNWTANKLLKGAGAGSDPTEVDVPDGVPSGLIAMWHGTIANIPSGWVICDGNNSTPNLLARFVEGVATAATNPGATGGATSKTTDGHTTPSHALTVSQIPSHTHNIAKTEGSSSVSHLDLASAMCGYDLNPVAAQATTSAGAGAGHTHGLATDSIADIRPLFYDIAFLMKT